MRKFSRKRRLRRPSYKRRRNVKRRRNGKGKKRVGLSRVAQFSGFPSNKIVRMRYAERISMAPENVASFAFYNFSANNAFDPNRSGTGHQPMGYDQWSGFYNHYVVVGSKITVKFIPQTPTSSENETVICGVKLTDDTTPVITSGSLWENISERGFSRQIMIPNTNAIRPVTTSAKYSAKKFFNVTNVKDNLTRIGATVSSSPTDEAIYQVWFASATDVNLPGYIMHALVQIDYLVVFSEPKDIAQS